MPFRKTDVLKERVKSITAAGEAPNDVACRLRAVDSAALWTTKRSPQGLENEDVSHTDAQAPTTT